MEYLPQFFPAFWVNEYDIFGIQFTDEICVGFVVRESGGYSYLLKEDFEKLNIKPNELLNLAINKLDKEFENCEVKEYKLKGGAVVYWNSENDNFTAVRLLSTKYKAVLKKIFPDGCSFSVPDRDLITFWFSQDQEDIEKYAKETIEDFNSSDYKLSDKVYRYSDIQLNK